MTRMVRRLSIAVLLLGSCGDSHGDGAKREPIRLGMLAAFSRDNDELAQGEKAAMELAIGEINAAGGLLGGRPVELVTGDDMLQPGPGKQEAKRLIEEEGVVALVGPESSSVTQAVLEVSVPAKIPNISCCATSADLDTAQGQGKRERYFFRALAPDSFQAPVLAQAALECHACTKLAIFHLDDAYGNPFAEALTESFEKQSGAAVVFDEAHDGEETDFSKQVQEAADSGADCAALIAYSQDGAAIRSAWQKLAGRDVGWVASEGVFGDFVSRLSDPKLAEGMVITAPVFDPDSPENEAFKVAYRANYDMEPLAYNAQVYDATALLVLAIARAGSLEGPAIRDALFDVSAPGPASDDVIITPGTLADGLVAIAAGTGVNYEGASGSVNFEDYGNVRSDYELYRWGEDGMPERLGLVRPGTPLPCPP